MKIKGDCEVTEGSVCIYTARLFSDECPHMLHASHISAAGLKQAWSGPQHASHMLLSLSGSWVCMCETKHRQNLNRFGDTVVSEDQNTFSLNEYDPNFLAFSEIDFLKCAGKETLSILQFSFC